MDNGRFGGGRREENCNYFVCLYQSDTLKRNSSGVMFMKHKESGQGSTGKAFTPRWTPNTCEWEKEGRKIGRGQLQAAHRDGSGTLKTGHPVTGPWEES